MPWPDPWQHPKTPEDTEAKAEVFPGGLSSMAQFLLPSRAVLRLCSPNSLHAVPSYFPHAAYSGLPFHSAGTVTVSVRDRQAPGKGIITLIRLYS